MKIDQSKKYDEKNLIKTFFENELTSEADLNQKVEKVRSIESALQDLMELCGQDSTAPGLGETPFRVVKAFLEYTEGYREDPKEHLEKIFDVPSKELIVVKDIEFYSMCEHHFAPFFGVAHVGYVPSNKVTGLSKIGRMVEGYARRFQVQERLTTEIADAMVDVLEPEAVMVVLEAKHMCVSSRGAKKEQSMTVTSTSRGTFENNPQLRSEFMSLIRS